MAENLEFNTDIKVEADTSEAKKSLASIEEFLKSISDTDFKIGVDTSAFENFAGYLDGVTSKIYELTKSLGDLPAKMRERESKGLSAWTKGAAKEIYAGDNEKVEYAAKTLSEIVNLYNVQNTLISKLEAEFPKLGKAYEDYLNKYSEASLATEEAKAAQDAYNEALKNYDVNLAEAKKYVDSYAESLINRYFHKEQKIKYKYYH